MSIFKKIERKYNWKLKKAPVPLNGSFMHKMYKLETELGTYVLKLLNPFVMQRETVMARTDKSIKYHVFEVPIDFYECTKKRPYTIIDRFDFNLDNFNKSVRKKLMHFRSLLNICFLI